MHVIFSSFGNDSLALIQWAIERELKDVSVVYSNTGWYRSDWPERVEKARAYIAKAGFTFHEIMSEGMVNLVLRKGAWPRHGMHFCTEELKIRPAFEWLERVDPKKEAICLVGIRREESFARSQFPEWTENSVRHGNRSLWAPIVNMKEAERNELIVKTGIPVLPHRSFECYPCINANKQQIRLVDEERIKLIEKVEAAMGENRSMFRPQSKMGATGIREVVKWAHSERGEYEPAKDCDSGMCGD